MGSQILSEKKVVVTIETGRFSIGSLNGTRDKLAKSGCQPVQVCQRFFKTSAGATISICSEEAKPWDGAPIPL